MPCELLRTEFPGDAWPGLLSEFDEPYMEDLCRFLKSSESQPWHPDPEDVFAAFRLTRQEHVRVVIVGQDPYPDPVLATGLAFSVRANVRPHPLSLRNIFHELHTDLGVTPPMSGDLTRWAEQDVLLLNRWLTVRRCVSGSHRKKGWWAKFTRKTLEVIAGQGKPVVVILWGGAAPRWMRCFHPPNLIVSGAHPAYQGGRAPARGKSFNPDRDFFGGKYFSNANAFLKQHERGTISW